MIKKHRFFSSLVLGLASAALVVACGDDDDDISSDGGATTDASPASMAPAETDPPSASAAPADTATAITEAAGTDTTASSDTTGGSAPSAGVSEEEWQEIVDAAIEEGRVTVYSVMLPNQNEALEQGFEAEYPEIDMEVVRVLGEMDSKLDAEKQTQAEGADVGTHVNYQWVLNAAQAGDLTEMVGPVARGSDWEGTPWNVDGMYQYSTFQLLGIGCNTNLTESCPTSYTDALRPEYDGLIGVIDPGSAVTTDFIVFLQEQLGESGMEQLRDLNPVFYETAVPAQQGLAAGEVAIVLYATAQLHDDAAAGAPVELQIPKPAWSPPVISYILGWAEHPNAAQVVLDYMASPEGQEAIAINGASALDGIPGTLADIDDVQPVDITTVTAEWAAPHQAAWQDFFGR